MVWAMKNVAKCFLNPCKHDPGAQLWSAETGSFHQLPPRFVSELRELIANEISVVFKHRVQNSPNTLYHERSRSYFVHQPNRGGKQIAFV